MLNILGLTVKYGQKVAVDDVTIAVEPGEIVGIVEPNGAGKSTPFKTVLGLMQQNNGFIEFNGNPISDIEKKRSAT